MNQNQKKLNGLEAYWRTEAELYKSLFNYEFQSSGAARIKFGAARKEQKRLYRKCGKKFLPVNDPYAYDGLKNGFWLIQIKDGCTSIRQQIYPDKAHITSAALLMEEKLLEIIRKSGEARPAKTALTPEQKKDWDRFIKKHGAEFNTLHYPSLQENAEKIIEALLGKEGAK
jgi:hypothetical protein